MTQCVNKSFASGELPDCLEQGNISPIFKKDDPLDKENYRPVSILLLVSKVYEKLIYNQLSDHVENIFNVILCGFCKAHNTQHALFKLLQSWQKELDENFADDNTLYSVGKNVENVNSDLKTDLVEVMEWFKINSLKANPDKFQFMVFGNKDESSFDIHINNVKIKDSNEVTLLGIKINKNPTFKKYFSELCRRASYKLHTLCRIMKYLTVEKAKLLANVCINSQFNTFLPNVPF